MGNLNLYTLHVSKSPLVADGLPDHYASSADVLALVRQVLQPDDREHFLAIFVDTRNRLRGYQEISVGSLSSSLVHPREAFRAAVLTGASAVLFAHNHPSGDPTPSREDAELTRRLREAGSILGIRVLDHIIVGDHTGAHYSFADTGALLS